MSEESLRITNVRCAACGQPIGPTDIEAFRAKAAAARIAELEEALRKAEQKLAAYENQKPQMEKKEA